MSLPDHESILSGIPMNNRKDKSIHSIYAKIGGVNILFKTSSELVAQLLRTKMKYHLSLPFTDISCKVAILQGDIQERVVSNGFTYEPKSKEIVFITKTGNKVVYYNYRHFVNIEKNGNAVCITRELNERDKNKNRFFFRYIKNILHELLWVHNCFYLHSSAVFHEKYGTVFFVGEARSGKTTSAISFAEEGWTLLTDDSILFQQILNGEGKGKFRLNCFRTELHIDRSVGDSYPRIKFIKNFPSFINPWHPKVEVPMEVIYPLQRMETFPFPKMIVFPMISNASDTTICQIDRDESLSRLLKYSHIGTLENGRGSFSTYRKILSRLVRKTDCFEVRLGIDSYYKPQIVFETIFNYFKPEIKRKL